MLLTSQATAPAPPERSAWRRRFPIGAEPLSQGAHFRVWAPRCRELTVVLEKADGSVILETPLMTTAGGYFAAFVPEAAPGALYRFRLNGEAHLAADPASRFQPAGPDGPSEIVAPNSFAWTDATWSGLRPEGQVVYEMHVGTLTPAGAWAAAAEQLPYLADLGVTVIELLPVAEFEGNFGWGYDGVHLFAPTRLYGRPDDFRRFVDHAHQLKIGVILDVVYNHFGPGCDYLFRFSEGYCSRRHKTDWGPALNFDGEDAGPVREFVLANAAYWLEEYHLDGFRVDATQDIHDVSTEHILTAFAKHARASVSNRSIVLIAENEPQHAALVRPLDQGGHQFDALWNDDFHHSAMVALTGRNEAYYSDYSGTPQELLSAAKWGFLYQGQRYRWQGKRRGAPALDVPARAFVTFLQNHDQVANSARGLRCHQLTSPSQYRALTTFWLLAPGTPLLFQGQEFGATTPFFYFADHHGDLAEGVRKGRLEFLGQFPSLQDEAMRAVVPAPHDPTTFQRSKLNPAERVRNQPTVDLHRDLLRLRRDDPVIRRGKVDGAVVGPEAWILRFFDEHGADRLLLVNLGRDLPLATAPEPLLGPPARQRWRMIFSSEHPRYGGSGHAPMETEDAGWFLPARAAVLLQGCAVEEPNDTSTSESRPGKA